MIYRIITVVNHSYVCSFFPLYSDVKFSIEAEAERREKLRKPSRVIFEESGNYKVENQEIYLLPVWDETPSESKRYKVIIQVCRGEPIIGEEHCLKELIVALQEARGGRVHCRYVYTD